MFPFSDREKRTDQQQTRNRPEHVGSSVAPGFGCASKSTMISKLEMNYILCIWLLLTRLKIIYVDVWREWIHTCIYDVYCGRGQKRVVLMGRQLIDSICLQKLYFCCWFDTVTIAYVGGGFAMVRYVDRQTKQGAVVFHNFFKTENNENLLIHLLISWRKLTTMKSVTLGRIVT